MHVLAVPLVLQVLGEVVFAERLAVAARAVEADDGVQIAAVESAGGLLGDAARRDVEGVDQVVVGAVFEGDGGVAVDVAEAAVGDGPVQVGDGDFLAVAQGAVRADEDGVGEEAEELEQRGGPVDALDHGVGGRLGRVRQHAGGPGALLVALFEDAVQGPDVVPESVNESAGGFLEVAGLGNGPGEVQVGYVRRFPGVAQFREPVVDDHFGSAFRGER